MKKISTRPGSIYLVVALLALVLIAFAKPAPAAPIMLRFATHMPKTDSLAMAATEWMDKIEKATNGRVKFEAYYDATLISARDSWEELLRGTADVYLVSAHNSPGEKGMPLFMVLNNGWVGVKDQATQLWIQKRLFIEFPELTAEWAPVKPLSIEGIVEYNIHSKRPVRTLADLKGMQMRGLGAWPKYTAEKLGASLAAMPLGEVSIALQKGILDGMFHDNSTLLTFRFAEVAKYTTLLGGVYPGANNRMCMNWSSWKKLPPDIQKIFEDMEKWINERYIEMRQERLLESEKFARGMGHEFISLPPADLARIHELLREEGRKSAEALDAKGLPGTKIYERLQKLIAENK